MSSNEELVDIETVVIDPNLSYEEKLESFVSQLKNPYEFMCKGIKVKVSFTENGGTLEDAMKRFYKSKLL